MTFDIGLHEVCVRTGVRYVITKFSEMDSLPNFLTHGAPLRARFARAGAPLQPQDTFSMLYFNQQPNLTTTVNFVTSSLLLTGHVSFPIPLGFQSPDKSNRTFSWPVLQTILQKFFAKSLREKKNKIK